MEKKRPHTRETLAANVRFMRDKLGWTQTDLAKRSGVSQKTISNIEAVNGDTDDVKLENIEKIARAFGLTGWQMIIPLAGRDLVASGRLQALLERYTAISDEGRSHIDMVAEREAAFYVSKTSKK